MPTKVSSVENRKKVEQEELSAVTNRRITNHGTLSGDISDPVKQDKPYTDHTKKKLEPFQNIRYTMNYEQSCIYLKTCTFNQANCTRIIFHNCKSGKTVQISGTTIKK